MLATVAVSAIWALFGLGFALTQQQLLHTAFTLADIVRIGGWFAFLLLLMGVGGSGGTSRPNWLAAVAASLVLIGIAAQGLLALGISVPGDVVRVALLDSLIMAVMGLVLVEQLFRRAVVDSRWGIKPLCLGLAGAFAYDLYLYAEALLFNRLDADALSMRGVAHSIVIPLIAAAAVRNRDWTSGVRLSRSVVFHSAALVASGVYLLFVAGAGYYVRVFGGEWGRAFQVSLVFAGVLLLALLGFSGATRAKLRVLINKHLFSYRYDYREEWLRFTRTLSDCEDQTALGQQVIRGLADMVESPAGALWLKQVSGDCYFQSARWNMAESNGREQVNGELPRFLAESGWVINLEEYRSFPTRYAEFRLPQWVSETNNSWLIVPLVGRTGLVGFVVLCTARTKLEVNWEVNDLLKTAGRQAASYLGQMQATEALLEARKFDAFNRMSAFVVHDLKNIVAQLSLMLKNSERHKDNPEFQQDMLMTVTHAVDRMKQLMMQLREGTTPVDAPRGVDLVEIVRRIQRAKSGQGRVVDLNVEDRVMAMGHEDRVERVIGHIVQNAIDATDRTGRVWVKVERHGEQAMVEIGDTGHGMTPEFMRERLFKPFQTTKQAGMGIGAYESHQYVQELGGRILVDSTPKVGTRVRVLLPLFDAAKAIANPGQRKEVA
jgi:putative PEP-CTERM system histidine kinase